MKLSSTLNILLAGAALLASTPGADAAERKLRGRGRRHLQSAASNDNNADGGASSDHSPIADGQEAQQRRKLGIEHMLIYHKLNEEWDEEKEKLSPGTRCGAGIFCDDECKDGYWEYWDSLAFTACGKEPKWEDGARCAAGTTCDNNCKDGYYEYWDSLAFTACGKEPKWEDGARCAAGTTCDNNCKDGYYEYWDSLAFTACGHEPCWEDGAYCAVGTTCNECCNSWHYNTKWIWTLCGESY